MEDSGQKLYALQALDISIREKQSRLDTIAKELSQVKAVKIAQAELEKSQAILKPLEKDLRDLDLQVQAVVSKSKSSEERLYSGVVTNSKELQDLQNNIASLKKRQNELEEKQLILMETVEVADTERKRAEQNLKAAQDSAANKNTELLSEKQTLESELTALALKREKASATIDETSLNLYENLRPQKAFRPVARLTEDNTCSVCGIEQNVLHVQALRRAKTFGRCQSCDRIIII